MTIGKLAAASRVNVETVRFYEREGLIEQPKKQKNFRYYGEDYVNRIRFIKRSQELGFTLSETRELLDLSIKDQTTCSDILNKTQTKITEIESKIKDLQKIRHSLSELSKCCDDSSIPLKDCSVLTFFCDQK